MGFTFRQGFASAGTLSGNQIAIFLASTPTPGDLIVIGICVGFGAITITALQDDNGNVAILTPNSPSNVNDATALSTWLGYQLVAPANCHQNWRATFSVAPTFASMAVQDFAVTGATPVFDTDIAGNGNTPGGGSSTTPSITPASAGCLLYACIGVEQSVDPSGSFSPWTQGGGVTAVGSDDEFILSSASGATAVNFPIQAGGSSHYDSMALSIKQGGVTPHVDLPSRPNFGSLRSAFFRNTKIGGGN